jgi:NAD(P)-dependent dehydrogenase (short-subunit alcohol dehydrogenase family)
MKPLEGKIAVVAGATRGAGRGIACMLGEAGATVYCTGRSTRANFNQRQQDFPASDQISPFDPAKRPETIDETAEMVTGYGGKGIAVQVDHSDPRQVEALFERVKSEQGGRLDILVNDIWGGDHLLEWGKPFWEQSLEKGLLMQQRAVHTHIITSYYGAPLMVARKQGLIIEITDGDTLDYRGNLFYDLAKVSTIRLALAMSEELRPHGVTALALTPGFLRSEAMLEYFGVTTENWREGVKKDPHFIASETPYFVGRAAAALAADPDVAKKSGKAFSSWALAQEYGFRDIDGTQPNWGKYFEENVLKKA